MLLIFSFRPGSLGRRTASQEMLRNNNYLTPTGVPVVVAAVVKEITEDTQPPETPFPRRPQPIVVWYRSFIMVTNVSQKIGISKFSYKL